MHWKTMPVALALAGGCLMAGPTGAEPAKPGEVAQRKQAFERRIHDWEEAHKDVNRSLFHTTAEVELEKIDTADRLRVETDQAEEQLLETLRGNLRAPGGGDPQAVASQVRDSLSAALAAVEAEMNQALTTNKDRYEALRRLYVKEVKLRSDLQGQPNGAAQFAVRLIPLLDGQSKELREVATWWKNRYATLREDVRKRAAARAALEARAVAEARSKGRIVAPTEPEMEAPVETPAPAAPVPARKETPAPARAADPQPVAPDHSPARPEAEPGLSGAWRFDNPAARSTPADNYPPRSVVLQVSQQGKLINGTLQAEIVVGADHPKFNSHVQFSFGGEVKAGEDTLPLAPPAKGHLRLKVLAPDQLAISYVIQNPAELGITFGEVGDAMPFKVTRQK